MGNSLLLRLENLFAQGIKLYPKPSKGVWVTKLPEGAQDGPIKILNIAEKPFYLNDSNMSLSFYLLNKAFLNQTIKISHSSAR